MAVGPFICNLNAMTGEQRARHEQLSELLRLSTQHIDELSNGYALPLPAEPSILLAAAEFMTLESLCCPFIDFDLKLAADRKALSLQFTGPDGIKPFLQAEFGFEDDRTAL